MHILFVHQNYPAQFGHIARYLVKEHGYRCTFVSEKPAGEDQGVVRLQYKVKGHAGKEVHYCSRPFENTVYHTQAVYETCKNRGNLQPDLIVGHSGFGSTLFLRELYNCPIVNYFEYYYRSQESDLDFRPEFPIGENDRLRSFCRNAMILLDLQNCDVGYCPTRYQRSLFPGEYKPKLDAIFDGVDTSVWRRHTDVPREVGKQRLKPGTRLVTYVSRGFEAMRGFDIFMKVARRLYRTFPDVLFVVVGQDRVAYGGDLRYIKEKSFKEHVLQQGDYDLSKFLFVGRMKPSDLARLLSISDLHLYFTVPFVLSWSLFDALACGCTVVCSRTDPVCDLIDHERTGLLADFYDIEGLTDQALRVLRDPPAYRHLGEAGLAMIEEKYTLQRSLPRMLALYQKALASYRSGRNNGQS